MKKILIRVGFACVMIYSSYANACSSDNLTNGCLCSSGESSGSCTYNYGDQCGYPGTCSCTPAADGGFYAVCTYTHG